MGDQAGTSAQRIRIGLTGLAFAFLLVLLGSVISRSGADEDLAASETVANDSEPEPSEPLAELGVAPGAAEAANAANAASAANAAEAAAERAEQE